MNRAVHEYALPREGTEEIALPEGAEPLGVGWSGGGVVMFYARAAGANEGLCTWRVTVVRSNDAEVPPLARYLGSVAMPDGELFRHVFLEALARPMTPRWSMWFQRSTELASYAEG